MITSAFLSVLASALYLIFQFLPQVTSGPEWWTTYVYPAMGVFSGLSGFPVIGPIMQCALLAIGFMSAWQGVVFANWLYNKVRGSG
jgi:hypothetical protein